MSLSNMSNIFSKNFHLCFPKFKCSLTICSLPSPPAQLDDKTIHHPAPDSTITATAAIASTSSSTSLMIKNFNSLYDFTTSGSTSKSTDNFCSSSSDEYSDDTHTAPPDFDSLIASERFFFSSPGRSNSIFESTLPETPLPQQDLLSGSVAIPKYSPNPYNDFRRSMQEMVESMELVNVQDAWEHLHELLLCYLNLNPKETHNIIVNAFSDLVISLVSSSEYIHGNFDNGNGRPSVSRKLQL